MFKVLVIAYYFPPMGLSGVQRTLKFVKYLKDYNWEPTVLTTKSTGYYAHDDSLLKEANETGAKIVRVGGSDLNSFLSSRGTIKFPLEKVRKVLSLISKSILIPDNKKGWSEKAIDKAREILKTEYYDLIFVSGPPFSTFNMAMKLKEQFNLPLVVDYRDLWFGNQFSFYPTPMHSSIHKKMEYAVLKAADRIICTNRKMKEKILNNYQFLTFEDVFIIPHGFDPKDFEQLKLEEKTNNKIRITYSGIFYEYITPVYFLKAFKKLSIERPDIASNYELRFVGHLRTENRSLIRKLELQEFVKEYGYLDHKDAIVKIMSSDILWLMVGYGKNADTISSGKLFEYFGTRKPILACLPDGALKNAAKEYGSSFITNPDNIDEIYNAFIKIFELYSENKLPQPDEEFVEKHRRDFLTEQLSKQFQFLVKTEV